MQIPCFSSNFSPLILASTDGSCMQQLLLYCLLNDDFPHSFHMYFFYNVFFCFFFGFFQSFVVVVNLFIYLFIYFWLCWVFVSVRGLSLVVASGGHSSSRCADLSLLRPLLLRSTGSRRAASVVAAHGSSCSATCGIFPDQSSNPCPLHWQADSQPLHHQESPQIGRAHV